MKCKNWPVGVCSWSLQTDVDGVAEAMKKIGLDHVHLGVRAAVGAEGAGVLAAIQKQDWTISATMIDFPQEDYSTLESIKVTGGVAPDESWEQNRDLFFGAAEVTAELGVKYLSMHAGFVDERMPRMLRSFTTGSGVWPTPRRKRIFSCCWRRARSPPTNCGTSWRN